MRAPVQGVTRPEISAQSSGKSYADVVKDNQDIENGKREREPAREVMDSNSPKTFLGACAGSDVMDTPETLPGKCERSPVEEATDSDIPAQSAGKKCRVGDVHLACVAARDVVKEHAQW